MPMQVLLFYRAGDEDYLARVSAAFEQFVSARGLGQRDALRSLLHSFSSGATDDVYQQYRIPDFRRTIITHLRGQHCT